MERLGLETAGTGALQSYDIWSERDRLKGSKVTRDTFWYTDTRILTLRKPLHLEMIATHHNELTIVNNCLSFLPSLFILPSFHFIHLFVCFFIFLRCLFSSFLLWHICKNVAVSSVKNYFVFLKRSLIWCWSCFWLRAPCRVWPVADVTEDYTASIIRAELRNEPQWKLKIRSMICMRMASFYIHMSKSNYEHLKIVFLYTFLAWNIFRKNAYISVQRCKTSV